jgi:DNA repair exonuclease SbcCD ATPase subunit
VLLLDEPTNDLDTDTLASLEDLLDSWPGTLVVASHDRYLVERVTDTVYAMYGDGRLVHLPGGVAAYSVDHEPGDMVSTRTRTEPHDRREKQRALARLERQVGRLEQREASLHEQLATHATDYAKLSELDAELREVQAELARAEEAWLALAEQAET